MRNRRFFAWIGILLISILCVYALVHTARPTAPVMKAANTDTAQSLKKNKNCRCCEKINIAKKRVQERLRKREVPTAPQDKPQTP